ncbi:probable cytochrome P450 519D1 [Choristoneura fumiferana]|uniref:probable cytochrome P450 519D1 n=1 Tax=Choristoneura fumiferana TaxID=7141 RepID=UPI003D15E414
MLFLILLLAVAMWGLNVLKFHVSKKRQRLLALAAQVPSDKAALPFIGHAYKFIGGNLGEELQRLSKLAESEGGVIKIWIASSPMFIVNDPDDAFTVLNSCLKKNLIYDVSKRCFGNGLILADATP